MSSREQQVPHRAFSPVRNDILFHFQLGFGMTSFYLWRCSHLFEAIPKLLSFRRAPKAREEPAVLLSGASAGVVLPGVCAVGARTSAKLSARVLGLQENSRFLTGLSARFGMTSLFYFQPDSE
jgi:hypothetical protein